MDLTPKEAAIWREHREESERTTGLTLMAERFAFISISAEPTRTSGGRARADQGAMNLDERRPTHG